MMLASDREITGSNPAGEKLSGLMGYGSLMIEMIVKPQYRLANPSLIRLLCARFHLFYPAMLIQAK